MSRRMMILALFSVFLFANQAFASFNVQFINKTNSDIEVLYESGVVNSPKRIVVRYKDVEIVTGTTRFKVKVFHKASGKFLGEASLNNVKQSITFSQSGTRFEIRAG